MGATTPGGTPCTVVDASSALRTMPALAARITAAGHRLLWPETPPRSAKDVREYINDADAVIAGGREPYGPDVLAAATRLRVIARTGVGYDQIDVPAASARGIYVATTPGTLEGSVADHTLLLILAAARRLLPMDASVRQGAWERMSGWELAGKRLGILGFGRIGREVARRAVPFGLAVSAYDPVPDRDAARRLQVTLAATWMEVTASADIVSLHLPLLPELERFVSRDFLRRMKPGSILINTARGALVDEAALYDALLAGHLRAAALDVLAVEPAGREHPLLRLPNVILTPHVASFTDEAWLRVVAMAVDNALAALDGRIPAGALNPSARARD